MSWLLSKLTSCIYRRHQTKHDESIVTSYEDQNFELSAFERLPDELLLDIFQYIPVIDLFNGFVNLNSHLNRIFHDLRIAVQIRSDENKNIHLENALRYFATQIIYINVYRYPLLNLQQFPHLRSLIIYLPTIHQLASISTRFMPRLTRLRLGTIKQSHQSIVATALCSEHQFAMLHFCNFFELDSNYILIGSKPCLAIRTLVITNCKPIDFIKFLPLLPNLHRLKIDISTFFSSSLSGDLTVYRHEKLIDLEIQLSQYIPQLTLIERLFSFVPHVQRCTLYIYGLNTIDQYARLEKILTNKLTQLRHLNCTIDNCPGPFHNSLLTSDYDHLRLNLPFFEPIHVTKCSYHSETGCVDYIHLNKQFVHIS